MYLSAGDSGVHDAQRLKELQALPLDRKIQITQTRILEWIVRWKQNGHGVYVSFSGGKDSLVLLTLSRMVDPTIPAVFVNTGLEYPEIQKFAKSFDNVIEIRPKMSFMDVVFRYGYPIVGKEVSNALYLARGGNAGRLMRLRGELRNRDGSKSAFNCDKYFPLFSLPVKLSADCCRVMKKGPCKQFENKTGLMPITGTQAEESRQRKQHWFSQGCNAFTDKRPISNPMSFWTEQDVLTFLVLYGPSPCSVYGDIVQDEKTKRLRCSGCQRTGCVFCGYGIQSEKGETRFQRLAKTHPRQYEYCIGGGQWIDNPKYDATSMNKEAWNPKQLWVPSKDGLGMGKVFDMCNDIYGKDFMRYK